MQTIDQQTLEARIQKAFDKHLITDDTISGMMKVRVVACDAEKRTLELAFPVQEWQKNLIGMMHGGLICTALDMAMGWLTLGFTDAAMTPTVSMNVNFLRAIPMGAELFATSHIEHLGKSIVHLTASCYFDDPARPAATAQGVFYSLPK